MDLIVRNATTNGPRLMRPDGYGLSVGHRADLAWPTNWTPAIVTMASP